MIATCVARDKNVWKKEILQVLSSQKVWIQALQEVVTIVAPLVLAYGLGAGLSGAYSLGQMYDSYRYWNDYKRNTGYSPRYPFRSGQFDWMRSGGDAFYTSAYGYAYYRRYGRRRR